MIETEGEFSLSVSPDGRTIATGGYLNGARLWDVEAGRPRADLDEHTEPNTCSEYSPDGRYLATARSDKSVVVWDAASGKQVWARKGHTDAVYNVAFSQDGRELLSTGRLGGLLLWDVEHGRLNRSFEGHERWVNTACFVPGGKHIATASDDGTVRVWEKASGRQLLIIQTKPGGNDVAVSPDGKWLAVRSLNLIRLYPFDLSLYDVDPAALLAEAEREGRTKLAGFSLVPHEEK